MNSDVLTADIDDTITMDDTKNIITISSPVIELSLTEELEKKVTEPTSDGKPKNMVKDTNDMLHMVNFRKVEEDVASNVNYEPTIPMSSVVKEFIVVAVPKLEGNGYTCETLTVEYEWKPPSRFEMSLMGEMKFFLGLQIHQSPSDIFINQAKYTLEILHKHGMDKGQSIGTAMATKPKLDADLSGNPVDQTDYHSKIGSLMYLTSSRPDIVQAVCFCARYQSRPTEKHLKEVKRIFRYLRGTVHMRLWYPKDYSFELTAFSDADHAGSEVEYVALSASCAQVMWMRAQLQDYGFNYNKIPLYLKMEILLEPSSNKLLVVLGDFLHLCRIHGSKRRAMAPLRPRKGARRDLHATR
nr:hypothetical protein [Tanacetum cinerariifolium]